MIITCDASCDMGFFYLKPPIDMLEYFNTKENHLFNYVDKQSLKIPLLDGEHIIPRLNRLSFSTKPYQKALKDEDIDAEFFNDLDSEGYLSGIELNLSKDRLLSLVNNDAFKCYSMQWMNKDFKLYTFDIDNEVFHSDLIIFSLNEKNDSFVIVKLAFGNVGIIKGLFTNREDIYPFEYMSEPQFLLSE